MDKAINRKKIVMILDEYPYGYGEYSFIKTELEFLIKQYDVALISVAQNAEKQMSVDDSITVYHCQRKFGILQKITAVIGFCLSKCGRYEIVKIINGRVNIWGRLYDSIVYYSSANQLRKYVKKNNIIDSKNTIIYSYWFNANCLAFLMDRAENEPTKVISRIHGYDLYNGRNPHGRQPFREYMDKTVDKIFFVADKGLEYYLSNWGSTDEIGSKYLVFPIGTVNENKIKLGYQKKDDFHIVSCSSAIELKRVDLIIDALAQINDIKINWTHLGGGVLLDELKIKAERQLGRKSNISYCFKGCVPVESVIKYYDENQVDCFITTSSTEGCPVSIQEAMSFGIPIIGTSVGEISNMINGNGVLLSDNPSIKEICSAIRSLYSATEAELNSMNVRSRQIWEEKYNAILNSKNFIKELEKL